MSNEELLRRVSLGDREAFLLLYQNTDRTVYSFILSIMKNPQDAEEVMQETYMKIWTSASSYQSQGKPLAWIFTIARNLCYMKFRDQKHRADMGLEELTGEETGELCLPLENLADAMALRAALESKTQGDCGISWYASGHCAFQIQPVNQKTKTEFKGGVTADEAEIGSGSME